MAWRSPPHVTDIGTRVRWDWPAMQVSQARYAGVIGQPRKVSQASHAGVTSAGPRVRWHCPSVQLSGIHELGSCGTVQPVAMLVHVYSLPFLHHTQHPVHVGPTCVGHTHTHAHTHARTHTHIHTLLYIGGRYYSYINTH